MARAAAVEAFMVSSMRCTSGWAAIGLVVALPLRRWYKRRYYPVAEA